MKKTHLILSSVAMSAMLIFSGCQSSTNEGEAKTTEVKVPTYDTSNPKSIAENIVAASGGLDKLKSLKDVSYTYIYDNVADTTKDISEEAYIFEGELSEGKYTTHEKHVFPGKEGIVVQKFDGSKVSVELDGKPVTDEKEIGTAAFLRKVNYFWLTMFFKLADPGINYEYLGQEEVKGINYDKLKVTYDGAITKKEANDGYIFYVNPETKMVDQFLFSLPAFGVNDIVLLMEVDYEEVDGVKLPTVRRMYAPLPTGGYTPKPVLFQYSKNVKFNTGLTTDQFAVK